MGFGVIQCVVAHHPSEVGSTRGWLHDPSYSIHSANFLSRMKTGFLVKGTQCCIFHGPRDECGPGSLQDLPYLLRPFFPCPIARCPGPIKQSYCTHPSRNCSFSLFRMYLLFVERHSNESWCSWRKVALLALRFNYQIHMRTTLYILSWQKIEVDAYTLSFHGSISGKKSSVLSSWLTFPPLLFLWLKQHNSKCQVATSPISKTQLSFTSDSSSLYTCPCSKHLDTPC